MKASLFLLVISILYTRHAISQTINDAIYYGSLNKTIHQGQYDGVISGKDLVKHGDFAVGSIKKLAGEVVMTDGKAYVFAIGVKARRLTSTDSLPFAATKFFKAEQKFVLNRPLSLQQLKTFLDSVRTKNAFAAIKISGSFTTIKYKIYQPQEKPYPPTTAVPVQLMDSTQIRGTIAGFYTPTAALVLNSPAYHFHFMNQAHTSGGHVEDLLISRVTIEIDYATALHIALPAPRLLQNIDLEKQETGTP